MPPSQGYKTSHLMTGRFAAACLAATILAGVATAFAQEPAQQPYKPLPPPDFSGLWQHTPIAVFEGVPFKADPVHYAPQFGNYCAMALAKGQIVVANPENWLISDGKLYVFGSPAPAGPVLFEKDLSANIVKANQNRTIVPKN